MKKAFVLFLVLFAGLLTSCDKEFDKKFTQLKYEVTFIEPAPFVRKSDAQLIGLVTGGLGGYLIGDVATDVLDKTGIESNKNNVTLSLRTKDYNFKKFNNYSIVLEDVPKTVPLKEGDVLTIPVEITYYKDKYNNVYHTVEFKSGVVSDYTSWDKE